MIINLIPIIFTIGSAYLIYQIFVIKNLDCPINNASVQGLDKGEISDLIKDKKQEIKDLREKIGQTEQERRNASGEEKSKLLKKKQDQVQELEKFKSELAIFKLVEEDSYWAKLPDKISWNNGLWIGGFILAVTLIWKISHKIFQSIFRALGFKEET